jgi:DnaK suppressor protein
MNKKQLQKFKDRLATRQQELRALAARTRHAGRATDVHAADVSDRASGSYEKEFAFGQTTNVTGLIRLTEEALQRIAEGTFGQCVLCEKEINPKRLEAVPWTRYCLDCQQTVERR